MQLPTQLKFLNDNHTTAIAIALLIVAALWLYGCESTTSSLIDPQKKITRVELEAEANLLAARISASRNDLNKKDQLKATLVDQAAIFSTTGTFNPMGLLNSIVSVIAVGSALDSRRKLKSASAKKETV